MEGTKIQHQLAFVNRNNLRNQAVRHRIAATEAKLNKLGAIETLQAVGSPHPNESFLVLVKTCYNVAGETRTVFRGKTGKGKALLCLQPN